MPENAAEVAIGTYGRGIWILRDSWRLEISDREARSAELVIHAPRPAIRHASGGNASFVFTLNREPKTPLTMEVFDRAGQRVSKSEFVAHKGLNRIRWDLHYPPPALPVLRSLPPDNPYIWNAGRWDKREREVSHWGLGAAKWQPSVAPGQYTLRLTHAGKRYEQTFEVRADVELPSSDDDLVAGTKLQLAIVDAIDIVVDRINRIEVMRAQIEDLRADTTDAQLRGALDTLYEALYTSELHYLSRTEMHSEDRWYVEKYRLYMNLVWLLAEVGGNGGDVFGGAGYRPTDAAVDVFDDRLREIEAAEGDFAALMQRIEAFNRQHAGRLPPISDDPTGLAALPSA